MSAARFLRVRPSVMTSVRAAGTPRLIESMSWSHELTAPLPVGFAVGGDHALVDAPGGLDLDVLVGGEQGFQSLLLLVGE
jgi:hypothetical protein